MQTFIGFEPNEQSRVFPNDEFGYWKVTVERPLRLRIDLTDDKLRDLRAACMDEREGPLADLAERAARAIGTGPHLDFNAFIAALEPLADKAGVKLTAKREKLLRASLGTRDPAAKEIVKKVYKPGKAEADPMHGLFAATIGGKSVVLEYEPDTALRDTENVPLLEPGGIEAFIAREVLPYAPDAWIDAEKTQIGYEISFTRVFYKPQPLRTLEQIRADILALEQETDGILPQIIGSGA